MRCRGESEGVCDELFELCFAGESHEGGYGARGCCETVLCADKVHAVGNVLESWGTGTRV